MAQVLDVFHQRIAVAWLIGQAHQDQEYGFAKGLGLLGVRSLDVTFFNDMSHSDMLAVLTHPCQAFRRELEGNVHGVGGDAIEAENNIGRAAEI